MNVLLEVLRDAAVVTDPPALKIRKQLKEWVDRQAVVDVAPVIAYAAVVIWARLHGLVALEIEGNYLSMGLEPELLFGAEVSAMFDELLC